MTDHRRRQHIAPSIIPAPPGYFIAEAWYTPGNNSEQCDCFRYHPIIAWCFEPEYDPQEHRHDSVEYVNGFPLTMDGYSDAGLQSFPYYIKDPSGKFWEHGDPDRCFNTEKEVLAQVELDRRVREARAKVQNALKAKLGREPTSHEVMIATRAAVNCEHENEDLLT